MGPLLFTTNYIAPIWSGDRLSDWGRGRELHVKKAFDVLDTRPRPDPIRLGGFDPKTPVRMTCCTTGEDPFTIEVMDIPEAWEEDLAGSYRVLTCVRGECEVHAGDDIVRLGFTESCLVPAVSGSYQVHGSCRIISSRMRS